MTHSHEYGHSFGRTLRLSGLLLSIILIMPANAGARNLFDAARVYPVGDMMSTMAMADFTGDGIPDLMAGYGVNYWLFLLVGNGDGSFEWPMPLEERLFWFASSIATGDVNGDGTQDLVVSEGPVQVLLGNGDGTFYGYHLYPSVELPVNLRLGDLDSDGDLDLVAFDAYEDHIVAHLNDGSGAFGPALTHPVGVQPQALDLGDFNRDGHLDVAVIHSQSRNLRIYTGDGDGTFTDGLIFPTYDETMIDIESGDVNDDGTPDLVIASGGGEPDIRVLLADGDGGFTLVQEYDIYQEPGYFNLVLMNDDLIPDIVVKVEGAVVVMIGHGDGSFRQEIVNDVVGIGAGWCLFGDLDRDGDQDVVSPPPNWLSAMTVILNRGDGTLHMARKYPANDHLRWISTADLDQDGCLDLVMTHQSNGRMISAMMNDCTGSFSTIEAISFAGSPELAAVGDLNGDNLPDLAVAMTRSGELPWIEILIGQGDGTFVSSATFEHDVDIVSPYLWDLDDDQDLDLVVSGVDGVWVRLGNGDGSFGDPGNIVGGRTSRWVDAGDLDGNGTVDLLVTNADEYSFSILYGDGSGGFSAPITVETLRSLNCIDLGDLDQDGDLDLAYIYSGSYEGVIYVRLNDGTGHYDEETVWPSSFTKADSLRLEDVSGDGLLDALTDNYRTISVYLGLGNGGFGDELCFALSVEGTHFLAPGDLDNDGDLDLASGKLSFFESSVLIYENTLSVGNLFAAGPGRGETNPSRVRLFAMADPVQRVAEWQAYGADRYGVNVVLGELDRSMGLEVLTGAGPGAVFGPHVRGFEDDGTPLPGVSFLAYGTNRYGVNVATGDLDADGYAEIVTGAGPGAVFGPHVRAWNWDGSGVPTQIPGTSYFAYGTPRWGVNVACGDIDGDGYDEIVTGAGPGAVYGPHVRGWNCDGGGATAISGVSFLAYGTNRFGVNVCCGDIDGDGIDEIVTGAGPGAAFGPHVRGWNWDGTGVAQSIPGVSFFAFSYTQWGANVSCGELDGDGIDEILVGPGPGPTHMPRIRGWNYDGTTLAAMDQIDFYGFDPGEVTHGVKPAGLRASRR